MIDYFVEEDFLKVKKQRKKVLAMFYVMLGIYLLISLGIWFWYRALPYKSPTITWVKVTLYAFSIISTICCVLYMGIVYKRVNRFYRKCYSLVHALKETSTGNFLEYDETLQDKNGVDFKSLVFVEWNKYKKDFFERKVLVFNEWDYPEIPQNANVRYVTQGNVLVSYQILDDDNIEEN